MDQSDLPGTDPTAASKNNAQTYIIRILKGYRFEYRSTEQLSKVVAAHIAAENANLARLKGLSLHGTSLNDNVIMAL